MSVFAMERHATCDVAFRESLVASLLPCRKKVGKAMRSPFLFGGPWFVRLNSGEHSPSSLNRFPKLNKTHR